MGGNSAINGLVYVRGNKQDYNNWARLGNPGWDYNSVLPYFMKSENFRGKLLPGAGIFRREFWIYHKIITLLPIRRFFKQTSWELSLLKYACWLKQTVV